MRGRKPARILCLISAGVKLTGQVQIDARCRAQPIRVMGESGARRAAEPSKPPDASKHPDSPHSSAYSENDSSPSTIPESHSSIHNRSASDPLCISRGFCRNLRGECGSGENAASEQNEPTHKSDHECEKQLSIPTNGKAAMILSILSAENPIYLASQVLLLCRPTWQVASLRKPQSKRQDAIQV